MTLHPRTMKVKGAEIGLSQFLLDWAERHDLTWCEMARALMEQTQVCLRYILRGERQPEDPHKKTDEDSAGPESLFGVWQQANEMPSVDKLPGPVEEFTSF